MLLASNSGGREKYRVFNSRIRPNGTITILVGLLWQYYILRLKLRSTLVYFTI